MRFTVLFQNNEGSRNQTMAVLTQVCQQGRDLSTQPVQTPWFQTLTSWPDSPTLLNIPLSHQLEELEWANNALTIVRRLVNDVEAQVEKPEIKVDETPKPEDNTNTSNKI